MQWDPEVENKKTRCGNCLFFKQGDPAGQASNAGVCQYLTLDHVRREKNLVAPQWARDITHRCHSFSGQSCPTFVDVHTCEQNLDDAKPRALPELQGWTSDLGVAGGRLFVMAQAPEDLDLGHDMQVTLYVGDVFSRPEDDPES